MNNTITIDNYEEIMFRLVEDDFDEPTRKLLLEQIEGNVLFKFEWEQWQKTRCIDPVENYAAESLIMTEKIIQIGNSRTFAGKRKVLYLAIASIAALFTGVLLFTAVFNTRQEQVVESISETPVLKNTNVHQNQIADNDNAGIEPEHSRKTEKPEENLLVAEVTGTPELTDVVVDEIIPVMSDSVLLSNAVAAKALHNKPRYTITIETTQLAESNVQMSEIARNERVKLNKVFTNTKILFRRKPNGEPDKIILLGEEESYLCINLNQTIK
ncbi:MAG: hypothetical protein AB9834_20240 [Lentimicrobium sp.]